MKKLLSVLLATVMLLTCIPLGAISVSAEESNSRSAIGDVYYTDLFYAYPYYLAEDTTFSAYASEVEGVFDTVYTAYKNSPLIVGTGLDKALDSITSTKDITRLISDTMGVTDYSLNEALDAANSYFVSSGGTMHTISEAYGKTGGYCQKMNKLVNYFNKLDLESSTGQIKYTAEYYVQEAFDYMQDAGAFSYVSDEVLAKLWTELNAPGFSLSSCFKLAKTEIEIAEAIASSLVIEDMKMEAIESVLATQSSDTLLYQGMTRLLNQSRQNFVSKFIDDYLLDEAADAVFGVVDKFTVDILIGADLKAMIRAADTALGMLAAYPDYRTVLIWQVLMVYSKNLADGIPSLARSYANGPFISNQILKYENAFTAYEAINETALWMTKQIAAMEDPFGEAYAFMANARARGLASVTVKTGATSFALSTSTTDEELYDILRAGSFLQSTQLSIVLGKVIEISDGANSITIQRKANLIASILRDGLSDSWSGILGFEETQLTGSIYEKHIANVMAQVESIPVSQRVTIPKETYSQWTYSLKGPINLKHASNVVEKNCVYAVDGVVQGNALLNGSVTAPEQELIIDGNAVIAGATLFGCLTINGDADVDMYVDSSTLKITRLSTNRGTLCVKGQFFVDMATDFANYGQVIIGDRLRALHTAHILNDGIIRTKDIVFNDDNGIYQALNDTSKLYVSGDVNCKGQGALPGIVVFNGTAKQTIACVNFTTVILENDSESGVVFANSLWLLKFTTLFNHNGKNFTFNGYVNDAKSFTDYDGDGMKDHVDPQPTIGNPCRVNFVSEDTAKGCVTKDVVEEFGGTEITVEAIPTAKHAFLHWVDESGNVVSTSAKWKMVVQKNATYTAVFQKRSQPIIVVVEGGTITAPEKAEIESTVMVTIAENDGYIYEEGSLFYNGTSIMGNSFVMPDEPVVLTATFVRNEYYFALADMIAMAKHYVCELYTPQSVELLTQTILVAENALHNRIAVTESDAQIALLQQAINGLEMNIVTGGLTSVSEDVNGLAFKFDISAAGGRVVNNTEYVNDSALVVPGIDGQEYKLLRMGAVVSNKSDVILDLENVDGKKTINIEAVYLCDLGEMSLSYAVRIINIPDNYKDALINARPYYVYEKDGEEIIVYGDVVSQSYNAALNG